MSWVDNTLHADDSWMSSDRHELWLRVHPRCAEIERAVMALAEAQGWPSLAVGASLGAALRDVAPAEWSRTVDPWLREAIRQAAGDPLVLYRIDLLFEPALRIDPLRLLVHASRQRRLVVAWPGSWDGTTLAYGEPTHGYYRTWTGPHAAVHPLR